MDVLSRPGSRPRPLVGAIAFVLTTGVLGFGGAASAPEFGYTGNDGPGFWAETAGWEACAGTAATERQSPIDINTITLDHRLRPLQMRLNKTPLALTNNGHTIEQEYEPGSSLTLDGLVYNLAQFHFHTQSEHSVEGKHGVMELHVVFADPASDKKAVIGMLYKIGKENAFLSELLAHGLPKKSGDKTDVASAELNVADGLTSTSQYYTYPGSLTTPPCTETVMWFVLKRSAELSADQFHAFQGIMGNNFRPLQNRNHRVVRATVSAH